MEDRFLRFIHAYMRVVDRIRKKPGPLNVHGVSRARAFAANQALILGEELAFDPNPETWKRYCPFRVEP
ncbi:hypothetical protein [Geoalkalibacter halelectricus]|uniref:hypothetical protein n=1 Tax=Geoalkalibacter halelectricus TaxID=2847045 RepID=UPI003D240DE7